MMKFSTILKHPAEWMLGGHREGSLVLECRAEVTDHDAHIETTSMLAEGLRTLERGENPGFSHAALKHVQSLCSGVRDQEGNTHLGVIVLLGTALPTDRRVSDAAHRILSERTTEWGTVEGVVQSATLRSNRHFNLYEVLTDQRIECTFRPELLEVVRESLARRVVVSGVIHARGGVPYKVTAERIHIRPDPSTLPTFDDIRGLLA